jgi:hypothetical protein
MVAMSKNLTRAVLIHVHFVLFQELLIGFQYYRCMLQPTMPITERGVMLPNEEELL